jgi:hypothetical protein
MKQTITAILVFASMFAFGQQKDSVQKPQQDTVYLLSKPEMQLVQTLLRTNNVSFNGKVLTFDEVLGLIQQFESRVYYLPKKELPKK